MMPGFPQTKQRWLRAVNPTKMHWSTRLRLLLLIPGSWKWNAWVRDMTAGLER